MAAFKSNPKLIRCSKFRQEAGHDGEFSSEQLSPVFFRHSQISVPKGGQLKAPSENPPGQQIATLLMTSVPAAVPSLADHKTAYQSSARPGAAVRRARSTGLHLTLGHFNIMAR